MAPTQTALIIPIPQAEPAVADLRARFDRSFTWGVPAHVTICFPFLPPAEINQAVLTAVRETVRTVPRFELTLTGPAWFGDRVLWLAPEPDAPLRALIVAICARFPQARPYDGEFDDIVPHLTVGHDQPPGVLHAAADTVATRLPVAAPITALRLIAGRPEPDGDWQTLAEFPLG